VLDWYLNTALVAQKRIRPSAAHPLLESAAPVPALVFTDYDAAVDWSEREHTTLLRMRWLVLTGPRP
jgi:hypothetical protein